MNKEVILVEEASIKIITQFNIDAQNISASILKWCFMSKMFYTVCTVQKSSYNVKYNEQFDSFRGCLKVCVSSIYNVWLISDLLLLSHSCKNISMPV